MSFKYHFVHVLLLLGIFCMATSQNFGDIQIYVVTELGMERADDVQGSRIQIPYGNRITIICQASSPVNWFKSGGEQVTRANSNSNLGIFQYWDENAHLKINGFRKSYRGVYSCSGAGMSEGKHIILENSPPVDKEVDVDGVYREVSVGDSVAIQAFSYGFDPMERGVTYMWYHNGKKVDDSDTNIMLSSRFDFEHTLTLPRVQPKNFGYYTFQVSSGIHTMSDRIQIQQKAVATMPMPITESATTATTESIVDEGDLPRLYLTIDFKPHTFTAKKGGNFQPCIVLAQGNIPPGRIVRMTPVFTVPNKVRATNNLFELNDKLRTTCMNFQVIQDNFIDDNSIIRMTVAGPQSVTLSFIQRAIAITIPRTNGAVLNIVGDSARSVMEGKEATRRTVPICIKLANVGAGLRRDVVVLHNITEAQSHFGIDFLDVKGYLTFPSGSKVGSIECVNNVVLGDDLVEEKNISLWTYFHPTVPDKFVDQSRAVELIIIDDDKPTFCPKLKELSNGKIVFSRDNSAGSVATYKCDRNFRLEGLSQLTCQQNGTWNGYAPKCVGSSTKFSGDWIIICSMLFIIKY